MIEMKDVWRIYDTGKIKVEALRGVDLSIKKGEFIAIMGPSGSGKSTLMHILGCLDTPSRGSYILDGDNVQNLDDNRLADIRNRKVGFVFQNFNLLPYASAYENVELPLIFMGTATRERQRKVRELFKLVGLENRMDHKPNELSGGQQQRVAIARALVNDPRIILADEPTGNLDSQSEKEIMELFRRLWQEGNTILMITHDESIADIAQKVIHLRDGRVENGHYHPETETRNSL
ncbi:MAG: ABC transporter ATP-binding protein [Calditrichia bacterium]